MAEEMSGYAASLERAEAGSQPEGVEVVTGVRIDADTGKPQWTFYSTPPPGSGDTSSGGATGGQM